MWNYSYSCNSMVVIIQTQISMSKKKERTSAKRRYARISLKKRKQLVRMVMEQGQSIANSIKKLRLKLTTARLILQKYKETGTFPMRKFKKVGKMLLDLQETLIKQEQFDEEESIYIKYLPETVKEEFRSELDLGCLIKSEEKLENSSNDSILNGKNQ